jgi:hypothetical protein
MSYNICNEVEVGGRVDLWDNNGVQIRRLQLRPVLSAIYALHYLILISSYHFCQVVQGKATLDSIDPRSLFTYSSGPGLVEELAKIDAGFGFLCWRHGILQVVCYAIDIEATRLFKELLRRAGNWVGVNWLPETVP